MSKIRAKFHCNAVTEHAYGNKTAYLNAVYADGEPENQSFNTATPSGSVEIGIDKDAPAKDFLKPGKSYYLDFTEAPE